MPTKTRKRLDEQARMYGWTHRIRGVSKQPYLKKYTSAVRPESSLDGATYITMDQKYKWFFNDEVVQV